MKKKVMLASLLAIRLVAGIGTRIHAQNAAYLCGNCHSHTHSAVDGCLRALKEQQMAGDAVAKRQAEAAQRQTQATRKQNVSTTPVSNTAVQPGAVSAADINSSQQPGSQTAQQVADITPSPHPHHENYDGVYQHSENCDGTHQLNENCNNSMQGYHHGEDRSQGAHRGSGSGHHG